MTIQETLDFKSIEWGEGYKRVLWSYTRINGKLVDVDEILVLLYDIKRKGKEFCGGQSDLRHWQQWLIDHSVIRIVEEIPDVYRFVPGARFDDFLQNAFTEDTNQ